MITFKDLYNAEETVIVLRALASYDQDLRWPQHAIRGILAQLSQEELEDCLELDPWLISHCNGW